MQYQFITRLYAIAALILVNISLIAQVPSDWTAPDPPDFTQQMTTTAIVVFNGEATRDPNDRVAYFIDGEFRNITSVSELPPAVFPQEVAHFSTIYGNSNQGSTVTAMVYHAATNTVYFAGTFDFFRDTQRGTIPNPDTLAIPNGVVLPVVLTEFTGWRDKGNDAMLRWQVALEEAFSHYEIERQTGVSDFEMIHSQPGGLMQYTYTDKYLPPTGAGLYRLKMVDLDGTFSYSPIISVDQANGPYGATGHIYPNPSSKGAVIQLTELAGTTDQQLILYNATSGRFTVTANDGKLVLPVNLPAGMYHLQYADGNRVYQARLVVN